jgi:hypothetical protein
MREVNEKKSAKGDEKCWKKESCKNGISFLGENMFSDTDTAIVISVVDPDGSYIICKLGSESVINFGSGFESRSM